MDACKGCGKDMESTHWAGCHEVHPQCAAYKAGLRRAAALLSNRFLQKPSISMEDVAYNTSLRSAIDAILAEADK